MNVLNTLWQRYKKKQTDTQALAQYHIWYPAPDTDKYELRTGEAPPDDERPQHLRHRNLNICLGEVMDKIVRVGKDMQVKDAHDASIAIAKIVGVSLPAFSENHVPKKKTEVVPTSIIKPTLTAIQRFAR